ncbi:MAG: hypothetical protein U0836_11380 [Pirellulales bacterium]
MNGYRVVGVCRAEVDHPSRHQHIVAVGTVKLSERSNNPTHLWTHEDIQADGGWTRFALDRDFSVSKRSIAVTSTVCHECGAPCLKVEPLAWARLLPECPIDDDVASMLADSSKQLIPK